MVAASKLGGVIGGGGDPVQTAVSVSDAAAHIMDTVREQQAKEAARNNDNEFNIRKNFLDNAVAAIQDATYSQFNTVICTDQAHDDFQNLTGQILRMDLIDVEVAQGKVVNFQVYVFDTGKYLRHGKWERDHWWWWGASKVFHDSFAMHVHFEKAQPKIGRCGDQAEAGSRGQRSRDCGSGICRGEGIAGADFGHKCAGVTD